MKKVKMFFLIIINIMFFYTNEIYATTTGTYVPTESNGIEKFILIGIGIVAVAFVLFIGYKMDKRDESKKRREKFIKNSNNEKDIIQENNIVDNYDEKYIEEDEEVYEEENYEEPHIEEKEEILTGINDEDIDVEDILQEYAEEYIENEINEKDYNTEEYDEIEEDDKNEVDEEYIEEQEDDEEVEVVRQNRNIDEMINVLGNSDSTMVFNSQLLRDENIDNIGNVKGYDYEDDDLSDHESKIKEANKKKYVRNKEAENLLKKGKKQKNNAKRYTRKKEKKEELKNKVKRYTRKKVVVPIDFQDEEIVVKTKNVAKRGRPKKSEVSEKPKRGRPKKSEMAEKPKRGRPKKSETTSKTKKSTTRKTRTSKTTK
mgnify:CR=1 FL=1